MSPVPGAPNAEGLSSSVFVLKVSRSAEDRFEASLPFDTSAAKNRDDDIERRDARDRLASSKALGPKTYI